METHFERWDVRMKRPAEFGQELTEREVWVLRGIADGKSYAEMAGEDFISVHTAKAHARRLFIKLGVGSREHAVAQGYRSGILTDAASSPPANGTPAADPSGRGRDSSLVKLLGFLPSASRLQASTLSGVYLQLKQAAVSGRDVSRIIRLMVSGAVQSQAGQSGADLVRSQVGLLRALGVLQASDRGLLIASESTLAEAIRAKFASLRDEPEAQKTYLHEFLCLLAGSADSLMEVAAVYAGLVDRK